jgi:hypothetical protein
VLNFTQLLLQERLHELGSQQQRLSTQVAELQQQRQAAERERDVLSEELVALRAVRVEEGRRHEEEVRMLTPRVEVE